MIPASLAGRAYQALRMPLLFFLLIMLAGTTGYWIIGASKATLLDCAYMTFITIATIGFGEVVDLSHSPGGRVFTMAIGAIGIANIFYTTSKLTAFIVESELSEVLRRRRMQDRIDALTGHYIICGIGRVGGNVAHELESTGRPFVALEQSQEIVENFHERYPQAFVLHGDAHDDDWLRRAGIARAAGVFAVTGDDGGNLLITLTAKQLNPALRVVARCHDVRNIEKLRRVGADAIVSPDFTGGMRIASSMVRPTVVSFLDEMLRSDQGLRVEEVQVPQGRAPRAIAELVPASSDYILLAVRPGERWLFNPAAGQTVAGGDTLVVMTNPEGRHALHAERDGVTHAEFVAAWREGRLAVRIDPARAPRFVSARLMLPLVLLPALGAAVALALTGFVVIGIGLGAAALLLRYMVRRSSAGFVLSRALEKPDFYRDAVEAGVLQIEPRTDRN